MKMYICKLCTANQMFQSKFCLIIVQKQITAFVRIRPPAGLRHLPRCGFHPQTPLVPPPLFFAPLPLIIIVCTHHTIHTVTIYSFMFSQKYTSIHFLQLYSLAKCEIVKILFHSFEGNHISFHAVNSTTIRRHDH